MVDKEVSLGSDGSVDFSFASGVASVSSKLSAAPGTALAGSSLSVCLSCPVSVPLEALRKAVDGKLPAEAPALDMVFGWFESALAQVK